LKIVGIYTITHIATGRKYVGQSIDVHRRMTDHRRGGRGRLALAIAKYGWDAFAWEIVETCEEERLNEREEHWISHFACVHPRGFNLTTGGKAASRVSEETRQKIAAAGRGRRQGPETIAKRIASRAASPNGRGYKMPEHAIVKREATKRAQGLPGRAWTPEQRAAKAEQMRGRKLSEDARRKLSEARTGRPRSEAARAAISAGKTGKKLSPQHIESLREAAKRRGDDWRKKISETKKRRNAELRDMEAA
jgi:group I intron endonuclease